MLSFQSAFHSVCHDSHNEDKIHCFALVSQTHWDWTFFGQVHWTCLHTTQNLTFYLFRLDFYLHCIRTTFITTSQKKNNIYSKCFCAFKCSYLDDADGGFTFVVFMLQLLYCLVFQINKVNSLRLSWFEQILFILLPWGRHSRSTHSGMFYSD